MGSTQIVATASASKIQYWFFCYSKMSNSILIRNSYVTASNIMIIILFKDQSSTMVILELVATAHSVTNLFQFSNSFGLVFAVGRRKSTTRLFGRSSKIDRLFDRPSTFFVKSTTVPWKKLATLLTYYLPTYLSLCLVEQ